MQSGELVVLTLHEPFPPSACCLTWQQNAQSPAMAWLLDYLGDSETLNQEWLSEEEPGG
ncbi:putative DNA-binding transcriptional regulator [compost metagenome]